MVSRLLLPLSSFIYCNERYIAAVSAKGGRVVKEMDLSVLVYILHNITIYEIVSCDIIMASKVLSKYVKCNQQPCMFYINCEHNYLVLPSCTFEHYLVYAVPLKGLNMVPKFQTSVILNFSFWLNKIT